ncbi:helix-turn-helix domain-containing protein [Streptomyces prasinus]|uniref:helix-turn-helix domain-containing protein n=1 Tax=Streptomyces prasinus TaxID=67345 RepID=UPI0033B604CE
MTYEVCARRWAAWRAAGVSRTAAAVAGCRLRPGEGNAAIAKELRVYVRSVQRWRRTWEANGEQALRTKSPASHPLLSDEQFAVLGQGAGGIRPAGSEMDASADQGGHRPLVPYQLRSWASRHLQSGPG